MVYVLFNWIVDLIFFHLLFAAARWILPGVISRTLRVTTQVQAYPGKLLVHAVHTAEA